MKKSFLVLVLLVLALLITSSSQAVQKDADIEALLDSMPLVDKISQMLVISPKAKPDTAEDPLDMFNHHRFGGVILFTANLEDAQQSQELISQIQEINRANGGLPMIFTLDQEGGSVARLSYGTTGVGNMALAATGDPENARTMAEIYGEEISALGFNADYAPVVDVNSNPSNPIIGIRSFGDTPEVVSRFAIPFMEGLHSKQILSCAKHFPGHGDTSTDSHTGLPCITKTLEELRQCELKPFKEIIDAGVDMIITAHIQFPNIETTTVTSLSTGEQIHLPATMSRVIITDILREELGYEGVVVSDALEMGAISDNYSVDDMLFYCINAGVDMLLYTGEYQNAAQWIEKICGMVESGRLSEEQINQSVRRILAMKNSIGLLDKTDFSLTPSDRKRLDIFTSSDNRNLAWKIACKAVTVLKNDQESLPETLKEGETVLFLNSAASRAAAPLFAEKLLRERGLMPENVTFTTMTIESPDSAPYVDAALAADHVIAINRIWSWDNFDFTSEDGYALPVMREVIRRRHEMGKKVYVISAQLPYDIAFLKDADALLATYGSSVMRELLPEIGAGSAYIPSLPVAIMSIFGAESVSGRLPVNLPELDENNNPSDKVLFHREI